MYKKVSADEKKKIREEFKERFRQRIENGEVMDFT